MFWTEQLEYLHQIYEPAIIAVLVLSPILLGLFAIGLYRRFLVWRRGRGEKRLDQPVTRTKTTLGVALAHVRLLGKSENYPGLAHLMVFWGAAVIVVSKFIRLLSYPIGIHNPPQSVFLYASLASEIGALIIVAGGLLFVYRRYVRKPSRLDTKPDDTLVYVFVFLILLTGFMVKGYRIATADEAPMDWAHWAPISYGFSKIFPTFLTDYRNHILVWHRVIMHAAPAFILGVYICVNRSRLQHMWLAPMNVFFRSLKPKGALVPIDLATATVWGASKIEDFTWKQLLELDACTRCGRCQDNCPAHLSGKALSPKTLIQNLKNHMNEVYPYPFITKPQETRRDMLSEAITEQVIWDCTTCRACMQACPIYVEHIDKIVDMRRNLALERAQFPESAQSALTSLQQRSHPWRGTTATRTDWTQDMGIKILAEDPKVDIMYWVGCTAALEE
ncbi:MAG: 4Fe-4S dicluster domain-containing protein, partial [Chloroflexi bacterium]|nr:4Fe-4S dicluster domain-containing protein [Chloroflexota bacterium]